MTPILVYVTAADLEEAQKIAAVLIGERLAACINLTPQVTSIYRWEGKVETSTEVSLKIKTSLELWSLVGERVREIHTYQCPEIIAVPVLESDPEYLRWWQANLADFIDPVIMKVPKGS